MSFLKTFLVPKSDEVIRSFRSKNHLLFYSCCLVSVSMMMLVAMSTFFNCELLKSGKDKFKYYTGFTYETFTVICKFLAPCDQPFKYTKQLKCLKNLSLENQLLLVLIKLRPNFDFTHISTLFGISQQVCSTDFTNWIILCIIDLNL